MPALEPGDRMAVTSMEEGEQALISRCRAGDSAAWEELFERHYSPACRFVWQIQATFTAEDVEEICQETFLTVVRSLATFQGQSQLQTWIFRIAANKTHDHRDRQLTRKRGGGQLTLSLQAEDPDTGLAIDPPSSRPTPSQSLIARESGDMVCAALTRIGGPCREILELRYFADLSYEEIDRKSVV